MFSYYEQGVCQGSHKKVCSGPTKFFFSQSHDHHQFHFLLHSSETVEIMKELLDLPGLTVDAVQCGVRQNQYF